MDKISFCKAQGASPIPVEGGWVQAKKIEDISGFSHGVAGCAPQQGACKLTINVKKGIIVEALVETIGCSGMTQSAAMAGEILPGKTLLEALNTDLVCDAINVAMKKVFLQLVYGRSQSAYSENGLEIGSALDDLGKSKCSSVGTVYANINDGPIYLNTAEGYITKLALDANNEIIGYEYIDTSELLTKLKQASNTDAVKQSTKTYGRYEDGVKFVDPREVKNGIN